MEYASIAIVGVLASVIIHFLKSKSATSPWGTKLLTVAICVILGAVYYFWQGTAFWKASLEILGISSTVYAFFLKELTA